MSFKLVQTTRIRVAKLEIDTFLPLCMHTLSLYCTMITFNNRKQAFRKLSGKGKIAGNQHFLLYPPCPLPCEKTNLGF